MRFPKWLPWTLGIALPVGYLAVTTLRSPNPEPAAASPQTAAPAPTLEKAAPKPERKPRATSEMVYGSGNDLRKVVYRLSDKGSPLTCEIFNAVGDRLLKCRFGYSIKPGPLQGKMVEAQVFDAQKATASNSGKDTPLQRLVSTYDADGAAQLPITINVEPTGIATKLRGPALVSFNPLVDVR
ncbi:hypothetical protein [Luteolibacter soli]|uniref:Uncharacterized protein n=1 Tax=Luteolibacter soli TaxID=3135280 RepID=A0ABU9AMI0_9BACT